MNTAFTIYCIIGVLISISSSYTVYKHLNDNGCRGFGLFFGFLIIFWGIIIGWPYVIYVALKSLKNKL